MPRSRSNTPSSSTGYRLCSHCLCAHLLADFPPRISRKDGVGYTCRKCKALIERRRWWRDKIGRTMRALQTSWARLQEVDVELAALRRLKARRHARRKG